jgi:hypothetical protein
MIETFLRAAEAYQRFDPAGWVSLFRIFPAWAGGLLIVLGVLMMLFGGGKLFRLVAGPVGAGVGFLWAPIIAAKLGYAPQAAQARTIATITIAGMGFLFPPAATFFAFGVPIGILCGDMAGVNDWLLGFIPGFFFGGMVAVAAHRYIGAIVSSTLGAWILMLGVLAALHPFTGLVESVAQQPWGVLIAALLFAIAGCVYQLFVQLSPEAREGLKQEKKKAKKKLADAKAVEKRWSNYSKDKGLD